MKILALLAMMLFPTLSWATDGRLIYGDNTAFLLTPPEGWVVDVRIGAGQGVNAALYPKGSTWQNAPSVMYVRVAKKKNNRLEKFVSEDEKQFQTDCPGIRIQKEALPFEPSSPTILRKFVCGDARAPNNEWVAYMDANKSFVVVVASSRSESDLDKIHPLFEKVLRELVIMKVTK